jgi:uroporphyrinogen-III synthase
VALLEARLASEAAALVRRLGGEPLSVPALREQPAADASAVSAFLDRMKERELACVVVQTGVGVAALASEAERLGRRAELLAGLAATALLSRGPKPLSALAALGVRATETTASPHTTAELIAVVDRLKVSGQGVGVVHHGERNGALVAALEQRGARVAELLLYEWRMPEDVRPLRALVDRIVDEAVDAVVFTTQAQVRHLFAVAGAARKTALARALDGRVVTAAVGPTCAAALRAEGIADVVVPENPKLGPLFAALASRLAERLPARPEAREV